MAFERVTDLDDLPSNQPVRVEVDGTPVCLVRVGDAVHAIHDTCSHQEYSLSEGLVFDGAVECSLHGSMFDLASGKPEALPATQPVPTFATRLEGNDVLVDVDQNLNGAPVPDHF